jgi:hypothetical protein
LNKYLSLRLLIFIFVLQSSDLKSQGLNNLWLFGYGSYSNPGFGGTNIDFYSGTPNIYAHSRPMNLNGTNAAISDSIGTLLFYTNGFFIANTLDSVMENGDSLLPGPFFNNFAQQGSPIVQGALIIPLPGSDSLYYLFHEGMEGWPSSVLTSNLRLSIIDMSLDNGKGSVIQKSNSIISGNFVHGQISAVKHANGRDWWILCHHYNTDLFYSLLITPQGVSGIYTQHIGQIIFADAQVTFSNNGSKYARYNGGEDLDIFDFDRCTGLLSNYTHIDINDSASVGGVAFSSNSQYLYVFSDFYMYQFDVTASNVASTKTLIATYDGFMSPFETNFFLCHLAPDGKIYGIAPNGANVLHKINYPDSTGSASDVLQHGVSLPTYNSSTLPSPPNYFLGPVSGSVCDSLTAIHDPIQHDFHFSIFPNPVLNEEFSILYLLPQNKPGNFEIYSVDGKKLVQLPLPAWSTVQKITLPYLEDGVYIAIINSNGYRVSRKIVVM